MESIGDRLKSERKRLGLNQDELAQVAGVQRQAQGNYERGDRVPDAAYLQAIASAGVDVLFVITGRRVPKLEEELQAYGDAWQVLDSLLQKNGVNLPADKKRQAAEAMYAEHANAGATLEALAGVILRAA